MSYNWKSPYKRPYYIKLIREQVNSAFYRESCKSGGCYTFSCFSMYDGCKIKVVLPKGILQKILYFVLLRLNSLRHHQNATLNLLQTTILRKNNHLLSTKINSLSWHTYKFKVTLAWKIMMSFQNYPTPNVNILYTSGCNAFDSPT